MWRVISEMEFVTLYFRRALNNYQNVPSVKKVFNTLAVGIFVTSRGSVSHGPKRQLGLTIMQRV